jgi:hypothetical protein
MVWLLGIKDFPLLSCPCQWIMKECSRKTGPVTNGRFSDDDWDRHKTDLLVQEITHIKLVIAGIDELIHPPSMSICGD